MGLIFDIKRYAIHDGHGIRTTVFFKGCTLRCRWCHNPESQRFETDSMAQVRKLGDKEFREVRTVGYEITPEELFQEIQKDRVFFEESGGGVTFSGGEPLMQPQFLLDCLKLCKENNINTCIDTAGIGKTEYLLEICRYTDTFLYDVKTADAEKFSQFIGEGYSLIWNNLQTIAKQGCRIIIRIPVIRGFNDTWQDMELILDRLKTMPSLKEVSFLPYHRTGSDKYKRLGMEYRMGNMESLPESALIGLKRQFTEAGFLI